MHSSYFRQAAAQSTGLNGFLGPPKDGLIKLLNLPLVPTSGRRKLCRTPLGQRVRLLPEGVWEAEVVASVAVGTPARWTREAVRKTADTPNRGMAMACRVESHSHRTT